MKNTTRSRILGTARIAQIQMYPQRCAGDAQKDMRRNAKQMKAHCLFEQSGTFKNEFRRLGIDAEDYDIRNDFGETDHVIDLFEEIRGGYDGKPSIFDTFGKDDLIMAFFPCIRFEDQILLSFRGQLYQMRTWDVEKKMEHCMKIQKELTEMYELINKLFLICIRKGLRLIVENPWSEQHYLKRYWCLPPTMIDQDRRIRGDYYKKPTGYWFVNCEPKHNFIFEAQNDNSIQYHANKAIKHITSTAIKRETGIECNRSVARSLIHSDYANRFIREFIMEDENGDSKGTLQA